MCHINVDCERRAYRAALYEPGKEKDRRFGKVLQDRSPYFHLRNLVTFAGWLRFRVVYSVLKAVGEVRGGLDGSSASGLLRWMTAVLVWLDHEEKLLLSVTWSLTGA